MPQAGSGVEHDGRQGREEAPLRLNGDLPRRPEALPYHTHGSNPPLIPIPRTAIRNPQPATHNPTPKIPNPKPLPNRTNGSPYTHNPQT